MSTIRYNIALKYPNGPHFREYCPSSYKKKNNSWCNQTNINDWIRHQLFQRSINQYLSKPLIITHYLLWNDQPPSGFDSASSTCGHTKGILIVHTTGIRLLVHSIPHFPSKFSHNTPEISPLSESELEYGQSLICVHLDITPGLLSSLCCSPQHRISKLEQETCSLVSQIMHMNPHIFQTNIPDPPLPERAPALLREHVFSDSPSWFTCIFGLDSKVRVSHVAKPTLNQENRYCLIDRLTTLYGGPCIVQSWMRRPESLPSSQVSHVSYIRATDGPEGNTGYKTTQDHSKWAVYEGPPPSRWGGWFRSSQSPRWVWIGDMNRMTSQHVRGGGGIVIVGDKRLWKAFSELSESVIRSQS